MKPTEAKTIKTAADLQADLATRYTTPATHDDETLTPMIDADFALLQEQGFVVIRNLLSAAEIQQIRDDVGPVLGDVGRNNFEGAKTQRVYNVLEKTRSIDSLAIHPRITGLLSRLLQSNYLLSQAQIINILPGEEAQPLHYDDGFYRVPRPRPAFGAATIWAIDEFTESNGATVVIPNSHNLGNEIVTESVNAIPVVMPAGSVVIFLGTLWHGGGENQSQASRLAVTCQYCEPWLRPQENFFLELSKSTLKQLPEPLLNMLGYSIHPPFMGMVNGMHPKRLLEF
jgi:ectoine hydroxylase-related dioxygenase (phytanoyl-CoA dioxygenase family)